MSDLPAALRELARRSRSRRARSSHAIARRRRRNAEAPLHARRWSDDRDRAHPGRQRREAACSRIPSKRTPTPPRTGPDDGWRRSRGRRTESASATGLSPFASRNASRRKSGARWAACSARAASRGSSATSAPTRSSRRSSSGAHRSRKASAFATSSTWAWASRSRTTTRRCARCVSSRIPTASVSPRAA